MQQPEYAHLADPADQQTAGMQATNVSAADRMEYQLQAGTSAPTCFTLHCFVTVANWLLDT